MPCVASRKVAICELVQWETELHQSFWQRAKNETCMRANSWEFPAFFVWGIGGLGMPRTWREKVAGSMLRLKLTAKGKGSTLTQCCAEAVVNLSLVITYTKSYLIPSCLDRVCLEGEVWKQFNPWGLNCRTNLRVEPKFDSHGQVLGLFRYQKFGVV